MWFLDNSIVLLLFGLGVWSVFSWFWYRDAVHRQISKSLQDKVHYRHIVLIIAHPDDESMFFAPFLLNLKAQLLDVECLSAGYVASSLPSDTRVHELHNALRCLVSNNVEQYRVTIGPMQDIPKTNWSIPLIITYLHQRLTELHKIIPIDCIVTFDQWGISGHSHHRAVHSAIVQLASRHCDDSQLVPNISWLCEIPIFTLKSVSLWRKYSGWLLLPWTCRSTRCDRDYSSWWVLNPNPLQVWKAMRAHHSQLVWFRRLYLLASQYVYLNTFHTLQISSSSPSHHHSSKTNSSNIFQ
jgi:N-acetylglucosaminylphosphatidylinositol deacetylase